MPETQSLWREQKKEFFRNLSNASFSSDKLLERLRNKYPGVPIEITVPPLDGMYFVVIRFKVNKRWVYADGDTLHDALEKALQY